jgi:hypothetical protein
MLAESWLPVRRGHPALALLAFVPYAAWIPFVVVQTGSVVGADDAGWVCSGTCQHNFS